MFDIVCFTDKVDLGNNERNTNCSLATRRKERARGKVSVSVACFPLPCVLSLWAVIVSSSITVCSLICRISEALARREALGDRDSSPGGLSIEVKTMKCFDEH